MSNFAIRWKVITKSVRRIFLFFPSPLPTASFTDWTFVTLKWGGGRRDGLLYSGLRVHKSAPNGVKKVSKSRGKLTNFEMITSEKTSFPMFYCSWKKQYFYKDRKSSKKRLVWSILWRNTSQISRPKKSTRREKGKQRAFAEQTFPVHCRRFRH